MSEGSPRATQKTVIVVVSVLVAIALLSGVAFVMFGGNFRAQASTHPPCDQLPGKAEVDEAIASHQVLVQELEGLGQGIKVSVGAPCGSQDDRALVQVAYAENAEREAIETKINSSNGFGVPIHVVKK